MELTQIDIYNYEANFLQAKSDHAYFFLENSGFEVDKKLTFPYPEIKKNMDTAIESYDKSKIYCNCIEVSNKFYHFLQLYNVPSIVTFGYIILEGEKVFYESKEAIRNRFEKKEKGKSGLIHAWLTLPNLTIIDPTFFTTYTSCQINEALFLDGLKQKEGDNLCYVPMFLDSEDMIR
ncbi:MAG: hypothetical protein MUC49_22860 [Raineya sp.]|nr:hypothetical protein [Raineya sp.]